jgi:hypothetical protein
MVLQTVEHIRRDIKGRAGNEHCVLSAAVFAHPSLAQYRFGQRWWTWKEALDVPVVMSYTQDIALFKDLLNFGRAHRADAIFGIGFLWPDMEAIGFWEEEAVRHDMGAGVCYFDYTTIDTLVDRERMQVQGVIDSSFIDTTRYTAVDGVFADSANPCLIEDGDALVTWGDDLAFAAFLLSLSLNPEQDLMRMNMSRDAFIEHLHKDVAAFKSLDKTIFPLHDELIEPPRRVIAYTLLAWDEDSAVTRERARLVNRLTHQEVVYPIAMDQIARAAFNAARGERNICETAEGIYVFEVEKVLEGGKRVKRKDVKLPLLSTYRNWTIQMRFQTTIF